MDICRFLKKARAKHERESSWVGAKKKESGSAAKKNHNWGDSEKKSGNRPKIKDVGVREPTAVAMTKN